MLIVRLLIISVLRISSATTTGLCIHRKVRQANAVLTLAVDSICRQRCQHEYSFLRRGTRPQRVYISLCRLTARKILEDVYSQIEQRIVGVSIGRAACRIA